MSACTGHMVWPEGASLMKTRRNRAAHSTSFRGGGSKSTNGELYARQYCAASCCQDQQIQYRTSAAPFKVVQTPFLRSTFEQAGGSGQEPSIPLTISFELLRHQQHRQGLQFRKLLVIRLRQKGTTASIHIDALLEAVTLLQQWMTLDISKWLDKGRAWIKSGDTVECKRGKNSSRASSNSKRVDKLH